MKRVMVSLLSAGALVAGCVSDDAPQRAANVVDAGGSSGTTPDGGPLCTDGTLTCMGKCVDLQTDADHCGACGVSCGDTLCKMGICQPVDIARNIATNAAQGLVVSNGVAYIQGKHYAYRCGTSGPGCQGIVQLWQGTPESYTVTPRALALGTLNKGPVLFVYASKSSPAEPETGVFYYDLVKNPNEPQFYSRSQFAPHTLLAAPQSLDTENSEVVSAAEGRAVSAFFGPNAERTIIGADGGLALAVTDSAYVYTTEFYPAALKSCPRPIPEDKFDPTKCTVLADTSADYQPEKGRLLVADGLAYWVERNKSTNKVRIRACSVAGCNQNPITIALDIDPLQGLVATPLGVFWTNAARGELYQCKNPTGCFSTPPAVALSGLQNPTELAFEDGLVYVLQPGTNNDGKLTKFAPR
jgi:hypothetical protein